MTTTEIKGMEILDLFGDKDSPGFDSRALFQELLDNINPNRYTVQEYKESNPVLPYLPLTGYKENNRFRLIVGVQFFTPTGRISKVLDYTSISIRENISPAGLDGEMREVYFKKTFFKMVNHLNAFFTEDSFTYPDSNRSDVNKKRNIAKVFLGVGARVFEVSI